MTITKPNAMLVFTFTAAGYVGGQAELMFLDDEPPLFQNQTNRYDIDGNGEVAVADALRAVNELTRRSGQASFLDPASEQPRRHLSRSHGRLSFDGFGCFGCDQRVESQEHVRKRIGKPAGGGILFPFEDDEQ